MWKSRFFRRGGTVTDPATGLSYVEHKGAAPAVAYREGRADQRKVDHEKVEHARKKRGGIGLLGLLILALAVAGGGYLTLAAREGSFAAAGGAVDRQVSAVTTPVSTAASQALDRTGAAVQQAGQAVEQQGEKLREKAN